VTPSNNFRHIPSALWRILHRSTPGCRSAGVRALVAAAALLLIQGYCIAQSWHTETVDTSGHEVGEFSSMEVDRAGNLHIAYWDASANAPRGQLVYAFRAPTDKKWSRLVIDGDGTYVRLAVDNSGHPHIVYNSKRETGLHYAFWDGTKWHKQIVDPGHTNYFTGIQLDAEGHPKISYYLYHLPTGEYSLRLKYAYFDGKQWYIQTVDQHMHTGKMNSLALDPQGNPFIAYSFLGPGDMLYARWDGSHWQYGAADLSRSENTHLSLGNSAAVDGQGNAHIAYFDNTKSTVKYASWDGSRWKHEVVDHLVGIDVLDQVSLKMDREGRPHIAYYDAGAGILKYAVLGTNGWQTEIVDREGNVGMHPSLFLDSHDEVFISYQDLSGHSLRLAHHEANVAVAATPNK
jgi:hypothetical protein